MEKAYYALYREAHEAVYSVMDPETGEKRQRLLSEYLARKKSNEITEYRIWKAAFQDFRLYLLKFGLSPSSKGGAGESTPVKEEDLIERIYKKRHGKE